MKLKSIVLIVLTFFFASCVREDASSVKKLAISVKDWSSPEKIDPVEKNVGEFLEKDLRDYMIAADQAYWAKDYKKAAQNYLYILSHNVYDIIATYNLACTYALMEQPELSSKFLFRAIDLGFVDFNYIKKDTDFDPVRGMPVFDTAIDSISQIIKNLGDDIIVETKTLLKCRIAKPLAFYPDKAYTVVIGLHGHSSNQTQMVKIWKYFDIPEFIFVVPQAPYSVPIGLANEFRWNIDELDQAMIEKSEKLSVNYIEDLIRDIKMRFKVKDLYILGLHQGASVAFDAAIKNPDLIKGVIAFGPDYDISKIDDARLKKANKVKYFVVTSEKDMYVHPEKTDLINEKLSSLGYDITYKKIDSEFSISQASLKESEKWFLGKK
jgi:predicted esterase